MPKTMSSNHQPRGGEEKARIAAAVQAELKGQNEVLLTALLILSGHFGFLAAKRWIPYHCPSQGAAF